MIWPDGSVHWLEARGKIFKDGHDKPVRFMGVNLDVTERKEMEAALRQAGMSGYEAARHIRHQPWGTEMA